MKDKEKKLSEKSEIALEILSAINLLKELCEQEMDLDGAVICSKAKTQLERFLD